LNLNLETLEADDRGWSRQDSFNAQNGSRIEGELGVKAPQNLSLFPADPLRARRPPRHETMNL
jgi:hypothetical protein